VALDEARVDALDEALDEAWELAPKVALRDEAFGALAYHFTTRRLTFLKSRDLVDVVRRLGGSTTLREALDAAGVDAGSWDAYARAVLALAEGDMVRRREIAA